MKRKTATILLILLGLIFLVALALLAFNRHPGAANLAFTNVSSSVRAMRVDYLDVDKSRGEVAALETRMQQAGVNLVAVGAGRVDWTYFPWRGHSDRWSATVKTSGNDILFEDSTRFGKWAHVSAVVDVLAPLYIQQHPETAISWLGNPSKNQVATMELVNGQFGQELLDMIDQIAAYYPVNSITITELVYYIDGYGVQDKAAYLAYSGRSDWPRTANDQINIDDPSIGVWRSYEIGRFLEKAAAIVHRHGKQLFVEMRIGVEPSGQVLVKNGTDINSFLGYVDRLVVRGSSDPNSRSQSSMNAIAQYLARYQKNRLILSIGLWDKDYDIGTPGNQMSALSVADFQSALQGGATNLWVTPSFLMSNAHWQTLHDFWQNQPNQ